MTYVIAADACVMAVLERMVSELTKKCLNPQTVSCVSYMPVSWTLLAIGTTYRYSRPIPDAGLAKEQLTESVWATGTCAGITW